MDQIADSMPVAVEPAVKSHIAGVFQAYIMADDIELGRRRKSNLAQVDIRHQYEMRIPIVRSQPDAVELAGGANFIGQIRCAVAAVIICIALPCQVRTRISPHHPDVVKVPAICGECFLYQHLGRRLSAAIVDPHISNACIGATSLLVIKAVIEIGRAVVGTGAGAIHTGLAYDCTYESIAFDRTCGIAAVKLTCILVP